MFSTVITLTVSRDVCHGLDLPPVVYLNTVTLISEESEATAMEPHNWSKSEFEYGRKFCILRSREGVAVEKHSSREDPYSIS